jgi:hypothetical protein
MTDPTLCTSTGCTFPLRHILNWSPFRIDALGIITMIGAEQVDASVGRLVRSRFVEYLPLLGAYIFASAQFADAKSGFAIYNLTAAIMTTDLAGWFSRWCSAQNFERSHSVVRWRIDESTTEEMKWWERPQRVDALISICIGAIINACLLIIAALQGDWWGLANAASMVISVLVRAYVLKQNRDGLDRAVDDVVHKPMINATEEKILVVLADAKMVTMYVPSNITYSCFISKPSIKNKKAYYGVRMVGWTGFTVQVVALGMSGLATQLITVFLMIISTVMTHYGIGCDDSIIGRRLRAEQYDLGPGRARRQDVYVALNLEKHEEDSMLAWNLMPHRTSPGAKDWWAAYEKKKILHEKDQRKIPIGMILKSPTNSSFKEVSPV